MGELREQLNAWRERNAGQMVMGDPPPGYIRDENGVLWRDIKWKPYVTRPMTKSRKKRIAIGNRFADRRKKG